MADKGVDVDAELALLLKEQEQFLQQNKQPSAKVTRRGGAPAVKAVSSAPAAAENDAQPGPMIVGKVVERDVIQLDLSNARVAPRREATGFPSVRRRGESVFGKRRQQKPASTPSPLSVRARATQTPTIPLDKEQQEIHDTNNARLQEMSMDEIREAQQELLQSLDPELVKKLMNRGKGKPKPTGAPIVAGASVAKPETNDRRDTPADIDLSKISTEEELQETAQLLPPEERAKHEWMQPVSSQDGEKTRSKRKSPKVARPTQQSVEPTLERFDFDGNVVTASNLPAHSGLYHHGDEPDAAGYTMVELLHLARSSVASQRSVALTVIAKVLVNRQQHVNSARGNGSNVAPRVLPRELPVTLRITLDDQNYTALSAGVSALHAFLIPIPTSETMVDRFELATGTCVTPPTIHTHQNFDEQGNVIDEASEWEREVIYIDTDESPEDGSRINDEDLAATDPVQGLLNMDIGTRFRFVLDTIQLPGEDSTEKMLDILIHIARHSPKGAKDLATNSRLLKTLQKKFIENEDVLTRQMDADNDRALRLTLKALVFVRVLCQGERAIGQILIANGIIQSTKGFLAVQGDTTHAALFDRIQAESLRIWRVLLGYGLDFHCFAYLFPLLSGFKAADLVQRQDANSGESTSTAGGARSLSALFAALEAFCCLRSVHEAQHYFHQLVFFMNTAADQLGVIFEHLKTGEPDREQVVTTATALRFMSAASSLAQKFHLETADIMRVFGLVNAPSCRSIVQGIGGTEEGRDLLLAMAIFHHRVVKSDLLPDDLDEEEVERVFFERHKKDLATAAKQAAEHSNATDITQACALVVTLADLGSVTASSSHHVFLDANLAAEINRLGLLLIEKLTGGYEFWITKLFTKVLFSPTILATLELFRDQVDATSLSNVLIPIYQALVNSSREQEVHSARNFAMFDETLQSPNDKTSYHLRIPQHEQDYVGSNLPLPSYWMYCPFSRMEYTSSTPSTESNAAHRGATDPTRAQSDEMKLIVSAACRFLYQFESAWATKGESQATLHEEDKLFHLLHVFFAGSDVLFDEHVDTALNQLLAKFVGPVLQSHHPTVLFDGMVRNLRRFQHLEPSEGSSPANSVFSSDEQLVLTFVERLVNEFVSASFGNPHFARSVTLFMSGEFPPAIRKYVWKELQDAHLLHTLSSFDQAAKIPSGATFWRCVSGPSVTDEQLLLLMKSAVCQQRVSIERGLFAYAVAIHHLAAYLFSGTSASTGQMSFARQKLAQELFDSASPRIWRHLLGCQLGVGGISESSVDVSAESIQQDRVAKIRNHAGLKDTQLERFERVLQAAQES